MECQSASDHPKRAWLGRLRVGNCVFDVRMSGQRDLGLDLACIGIKDVAKAPGAPLHSLAAYEMANLTHGSHSSVILGPWRGSLGSWCSFAAIFAAFQPRVTVDALSGVFCFTNVSLYPS